LWAWEYCRSSSPSASIRAFSGSVTKSSSRDGPKIGPHPRLGPEQDQAGDVFRIKDRVELGQKSAVGIAQHDPLLEAESSADAVQVLGRLFDGIPLRPRIEIGEPAAALVVIDDRGVFPQRGKPGVEVVVSPARPAVNEHDRRSFPLDSPYSSASPTFDAALIQTLDPVATSGRSPGSRSAALGSTWDVRSKIRIRHVSGSLERELLRTRSCWQRQPQPKPKRAKRTIGSSSFGLLKELYSGYRLKLAPEAVSVHERHRRINRFPPAGRDSTGFGPITDGRAVDFPTSLHYRSPRKAGHTGQGTGRKRR